MPFHKPKPMQTIAFSAAVAILCAPFSAQAGDSTETPTPPPLANQPMTASAEVLRLETLGFQLTSANADKCDKPEMLSGLIVHDISDYDLAKRAEILEATKLGYGFGVLASVKGSPAERAGLVAGDEIIAINGATLRDERYDNLRDKGTYDRIETFTNKLADAMAQGPVVLQVLRDGKEISLTITGTPGCGGRMSFQPGNQLNAWSDGRYVAVTAKMMRYAAKDDELAFVIAHEMAHNIKQHPARLRRRSSMLASFGFGAGKFYHFETEADDLAVSLLAAAAIDLNGPSHLLARLQPFSFIYLSPTHPSIGKRISIVQNAVARENANPLRSTLTQKLALSWDNAEWLSTSTPSASIMAETLNRIENAPTRLSLISAFKTYNLAQLENITLKP